MEIDVNLRKPTTANGLELKTISAGSYSNNNGQQQLLQHQHHQQHHNNNNNPHNGHIRLCTTAAATSSTATSSSLASSSSTPNPQPSGLTLGCCGLLSRLLCSSNTRGKTATSSSDYNTYNNGPLSVGVGGGAMSLYGNANGCCNSSASAQHNPSSYMNLLRKPQTHRRTPQEIYFESRGKSCKKLLKFNGNSNKILLYPEEGWARTASSSYWTITPCWWQPNRCRIEEFAGTQRQVTKAKMVALEQKGSLLIVGHFRTKNPSSSSSASSASMTSSSLTATTTSTATTCYPLASGKDNDEFKLYLSSNISMEDYNMGYCLTGFVERRCQQTNTFQMTHFAVIKRQWPSLAQSSKNTKTVSSSSFSCTSGNGGGGSSSSGCVGGGSGNAASKST